MEFTKEQISVIETELEINTRNGKAITSGNLFAKLQSNPIFNGLIQTAFQPKLSKAIASGEIAGYDGRRKLGYVRAGTFKKVIDTSKPKTFEPTQDIAMPHGLRLHYSEGNWTIEKKIIVGEADSPRQAKEENIGQERWAFVGYYGSIHQALEGLLTRHSHLLGVQQTTNLQSVDEIRSLLRSYKEAVASVLQAVKNMYTTPQPDMIDAIAMDVDESMQKESA